MPLITFTGFPSSGKTTWAKQLQAALEAKIEAAKKTNDPGHNYSVIYHSDETLGISHDAYKESNPEKNARGTQMSAVKRDLSRTNFVILDSLAYIKGFRYQLFCEAKGVVTPHCVVQVLNQLDKCLEWNSKKDNPWDEELMKQLHMRYEEPNGDSRWDSPLFTVASGYEGEELPIEAIWDALVLKRAPPPNAATLIKSTGGNNFLQELDGRTRDVVGKIVQHQALMAIGGTVRIDKDLEIEMPLWPVSTAQLQRIRRSYITLNRMRTVEVDRITNLFVDYVNKSLETEH
ncbi:chromatin associated protein KTI12 [Suhomyces tanzawaensis NRRL Y-17324]|uniref:Chromatin associated protein KTI12 n=1 Tax=Suhomyces tanzawaensis NRRL Y-17324 TaxID=984487 RepID=A0A1E4SEJ7_9ASCO|nr:chromatin associated protein KTI12 [Suhomyces tanzawaensis NRRL Y-17324]ODV77900.1 chromatin associated protein KTI12 [Suhomyces tanzawaensis NRRL Y-17324]